MQCLLQRRYAILCLRQYLQFQRNVSKQMFVHPHQGQYLARQLPLRLLLLQSQRQFTNLHFSFGKIGVSKGKGFQGVVKRHGFGGVGQTTHGQHNRLRAPGSIGACSYPARVFKGTRMAGQMGNHRVTVQNLQVLKVIPEHNLLLIKGSVPGSKGSIVIIEK